MTILWRDSMQLGDSDLDADHKRFIALLNLTERGLQENDVAPASDIFEELQIFVESGDPSEQRADRGQLRRTEIDPGIDAETVREIARRG